MGQGKEKNYFQIKIFFKLTEAIQKKGVITLSWYEASDGLRNLIPDRIERDIYELLLEHASREGVSFLSLSKIADKTQISRPTVISHLKNLEEKGFIEIIRKAGKCNAYKILPVKGMEKEFYRGGGYNLSIEKFICKIVNHGAEVSIVLKIFEKGGDSYGGSGED